MQRTLIPEARLAHPPQANVFCSGGRTLLLEPTHIYIQICILYINLRTYVLVYIHDYRLCPTAYIYGFVVRT